MKEIEHVLRHYKSPKDPKTTSSDSTKDSYACSYINSELSSVNSNITNVNSKFNYSTDEQVIGTWIDGKPLYRLTTDLGALTSQIQQFPLPDKPYETLWLDTGKSFMVFPNSPNTSAFPYVTPNSQGHNVQFFLDPVNKYMQIMTTSTTLDHVIVTLNYTKTTDSIPQNNTRTKKKGAKK